MIPEERALHEKCVVGRSALRRVFFDGTPAQRLRVQTVLVADDRPRLRQRGQLGVDPLTAGLVFGFS